MNVRFHVFQSQIPNIQLINDLEYAFTKRIPNQWKLDECIERWQLKQRLKIRRQKSVAIDKDLKKHGYNVLLNDPFMEKDELKVLHEYKNYKFSFVEESLKEIDNILHD